MASKSTINRRLVQICRDDHYSQMERQFSGKYSEPSKTITAAIREMKMRGFSNEAIAEDLEYLGYSIPTSIDDCPREPIHPLSNYPLCTSTPSHFLPLRNHKKS